MVYELSNSFSVCFNIMKIKYQLYNSSFDDLGIINPTDSVNVFINMESVLNYLSNIRDLDKKIMTEDEFPAIITSDILNLAAHYKRFFRSNNLETRVFLYMTDPTSNSFREQKINEDYRSYYLTKFNANPRYQTLTEKLVNEILPEATTICEFIPNVYFIQTKNVDASVVPLVISKLYPTSKNVIVTGDIFDTQYTFYPQFVVHYIRKSPLYSSTSWTLKGYLKEIFKKEPDQETEVNLLSNLSMYLTMLSVIGDKIRSIDPIKRVGVISVIKYLRNGIEDKIINYDTESIELLKRCFPDDMQEELENNFYQFSIKDKEINLSESECFDIKNQIVDRFDNNSLLKLNATKFYHHQLMLTELTM